MTNGDRIRHKTDEEIADALQDVMINEIVTDFCEGQCIYNGQDPLPCDIVNDCLWKDNRLAWLSWLKMEEKQ